MLRVCVRASPTSPWGLPKAPQEVTLELGFGISRYIDEERRGGISDKGKNLRKGSESFFSASL